LLKCFSEACEDGKFALVHIYNSHPDGSTKHPVELSRDGYYTTGLHVFSSLKGKFSWLNFVEKWKYSNEFIFFVPIRYKRASKPSNKDGENEHGNQITKKYL